MFFLTDTQFTQAYKAYVCEVIYQERREERNKQVRVHSDAFGLTLKQSSHFFFFFGIMFIIIITLGKSQSLMCYEKSLGCLYHFIVLSHSGKV